MILIGVPRPPSFSLDLEILFDRRIIFNRMILFNRKILFSSCAARLLNYGARQRHGSSFSLFYLSRRSRNTRRSDLALR